MAGMGTGVCGVCGRDGFGVLGPRGVNGLADGFSTCFFTTGVALLGVLVLVLLPVPAPAAVLDPLPVALATGVDLSDPAVALPVPAVVDVLAIMPVGVALLLLLDPTPILGAGDASVFGVACSGVGACCSIIPGELKTTGEVCGCCTLAGSGTPC